MVESHAGEVEPLDGTLFVVTANHLPVGDLVTQAIGRLIGVDGNIRGRRLPLSLGLGPLLLFGDLDLLLFGCPSTALISMLEVGSRILTVLMVLLASTIWLTIWIFSSPSSWLRIKDRWMEYIRRLLWAGSVSLLCFS
uniref:Uncharacterized protein n=1 Tax=Paramormyrops kingsleyae TaxID=1676925 RepID=A0A3B3SC70_9TELE